MRDKRKMNIYEAAVQGFRVLVYSKNDIDGVNDFLGYEKEANDEKEKEIERQKALTEAYSNMLTTLRDVQEEYEKRKRAINAEGFNDSVTGVHDMILTPQGRFSTDPDDYIIATKNPNGLDNGGGKG